MAQQTNEKRELSQEELIEMRKQRRLKKKSRNKKILPALVLVFVLLIGAAYLMRGEIAANIVGKYLGFMEGVNYTAIYNMFILSEDKEEAPEEAETTSQPEVAPYNALEGSTFPEKLDLRDFNGKNYVTSVKSQGRFGTCWTFGTIAAAETTLMTQMDIPVNEDGSDPIDLSERHLGWFTYMPHVGTIQDGEGTMAVNEDFTGPSTDPKVVLNQGGLFMQAASMLKSGVGVFPESMAPYRPDEMADIDIAHIVELCRGKDLNDEAVLEELRQDKEFAAAEPYIMITNDGTTIASWNDEGTWAIDEQYHYNCAFLLKETRVLPVPAYGDPVGVNAIKKELSEGRAVTIAYFADDFLPTQSLEDLDRNVYMHFNDDGTWAQYTYDSDTGSNHAVCVIGWDDTFPAENFNDDPALCPPGDGAWIVKNSWGAAENDFPQHGHRNGWGTNGTGYFYLSYYDCSIDEAETMIFDLDALKDQESYIIDENDFMVGRSMTLELPDVFTNLASANVFTAELNQRLKSVGVDVSSTSPARVTIDVYRLNDGFKNPVDGELVDTVNLETEYAGFKRVNLNNPVDLDKGDTYSIVVKEVKLPTNDLGMEKSVISIQHGLNLETIKSANEIYMDKAGEDAEPILTNYAVGVVNPGESFIRVGDVWIDLCNAISDSHAFADSLIQSSAKQTAGWEPVSNYDWSGGVLSFDNFAIKGYCEFR